MLNGHEYALHVQAEPGKFRATELDEVTEFFAGALQSPSNLFWVAHEASPGGLPLGGRNLSPRDALHAR